MGVGAPGHVEDFLLGRARLAVRDVLANRAGEEKGILEDDAHGGADFRRGEVTDVVAEDVHATGVGAVEAQEQVDERRLAAAGLAHERYLVAFRRGERDVRDDGLAFFVFEADVLEVEDGRAGGDVQRFCRIQVQGRFVRGSDRLDKRRIRRGLEVLLHDLVVVLRARDGALARIHDPREHGHRLLGHGDQLHEHDHVTQREVTAERAPEDDAVNAKERRGHRELTRGIHGVPPIRLRLRRIHDPAVVACKGRELARLRHEGLGHLHLADDLGETSVGHVDVLVFNLFELLPALGGERREPEIQREQDKQQEGKRPVVERRDDEHRDYLQDHREEVITKRLQELRDVHDRAVEPRDDRACYLVVVIALRQREQLREVARGEHLAQPRDHDIAKVPADIGDDASGGIGSK